MGPAVPKIGFKGHSDLANDPTSLTRREELGRVEICPAAVLWGLQYAKEVILVDGNESKTTLDGCNATQYKPEVAVFQRGCRSALSPCLILKFDT